MKMTKEQTIGSLYKILGLYENAVDDKNGVKESNYLTYLYNLAVLYNGLDEQYIYGCINGLYKKGLDIEHENVKSIVFNMIKYIERRA